MKITIEKTKRKEASAVAEMYEEGRTFLRTAGVAQWQDGYPALSDVLSDIEAGVSWLLKAENVPAASMAVLSYEPAYERIFDGAWLTDAPEEYLAVHRVCVKDDFKRKGMTRALYNFAAKLVLSGGKKSIRADTHKDNKAMRAALEKNGFKECGKIFLANNEERIAFEKIIQEKIATAGGIAQKMEKSEEKRKLVVATGNLNKLREIAEIFPQYEVVSQKQAGFDAEVDETGATFAENAMLKAAAASRALHCLALADDSGLCVEALNGAPGVYSARYCGRHGDDKANRDLLLENMKGEENRKSYFQSAVALVYPDGRYYIAEGRTYGKILREEMGDKGFGYDCIFESDDLGKSFGVASAEEKNAVSHRFRALKELSEKLREALESAEGV